MEALRAYRLGGGQAGGVDIMWKQEAPVTRCEDWVGASPHGAAVGVFFLCPSVLFPLRRRRRFCQEVFYGKFDGYSKYVCCITAPCVRINIA